MPCLGLSAAAKGHTCTGRCTEPRHVPPAAFSPLQGWLLALLLLLVVVPFWLWLFQDPTKENKHLEQVGPRALGGAHRWGCVAGYPIDVAGAGGQVGAQALLPVRPPDWQQGPTLALELCHAGALPQVTGSGVSPHPASLQMEEETLPEPSPQQLAEVASLKRLFTVSSFITIFGSEPRAAGLRPAAHSASRSYRLPRCYRLCLGTLSMPSQDGHAMWSV